LTKHRKRKRKSVYGSDDSDDSYDADSDDGIDVNNIVSHSSRPTRQSKVKAQLRTQIQMLAEDKHKKKLAEKSGGSSRSRKRLVKRDGEEEEFLPEVDEKENKESNVPLTNLSDESKRDNNTSAKEKIHIPDLDDMELEEIITKKKKPTMTVDVEEVEKPTINQKSTDQKSKPTGQKQKPPPVTVTVESDIEEESEEDGEPECMLSSLTLSFTFCTILLFILALSPFLPPSLSLSLSL
jgi:hypothetical protein